MGDYVEINCGKRYGVVRIKADSVLCNDVCFPGEFGEMKLWVIGNEYGAVAAAWAVCESEALDEAWDSGLLECFRAEPEDDPDGEYAYLGNHGEAADLSNAWMAPVDMRAQTTELLMGFAEARGDGSESLSGHSADYMGRRNDKDGRA